MGSELPPPRTLLPAGRILPRVRGLQKGNREWLVSLARALPDCRAQLPVHDAALADDRALLHHHLSAESVPAASITQNQAIPLAHAAARAGLTSSGLSAVHAEFWNHIRDRAAAGRQLNAVDERRLRRLAISLGLDQHDGGQQLSSGLRSRGQGSADAGRELLHDRWRCWRPQELGEWRYNDLFVPGDGQWTSLPVPRRRMSSRGLWISLAWVAAMVVMYLVVVQLLG